MFSDSVVYTNSMDYYTVCGHVQGMLDRDQRTAKLRCDSFSRSEMFPVFHTFDYQIHHLINETVNLRSLKPSRKNHYLWNTLRRLKQVLIAGIYLLSLISVPCSLSAPTRSRSNMSHRYENSPKWINPADLKTGNGDDINSQIPSLPDVELLSRIVDSATIALSKARHFKKEFAHGYFGISAEQLHENWKYNEYKDWLPTFDQIPKSLNESVGEDHLESLKLDSALIDVYHYLQMIAVGLEQVVWDQEDDNSRFLQDFNQSEYNLRLVLSEIQQAIFERGVYEQMRPDITRDWMPEYLRSVSNTTSRNMRDWIIYRDYMNILEYVIEVFNFFKGKL